MDMSHERRRQLHHDPSGDGGFTLIEILIVVVILAILASIVIAAVANVGHTTAVSACRADYKTAETAQEAYRVQVGTSATSFAQLEGTTVGVNGEEVGPWIKDMPGSDRGYTIGFDIAPGGTYGDITVATAGHPPQDGNGNCENI